MRSASRIFLVCICQVIILACGSGTTSTVPDDAGARTDAGGAGSTGVELEAAAESGGRRGGSGGMNVSMLAEGGPPPGMGPHDGGVPIDAVSDGSILDTETSDGKGD